jgi:hypothetical protein
MHDPRWSRSVHLVCSHRHNRGCGVVALPRQKTLRLLPAPPSLPREHERVRDGMPAEFHDCKPSSLNPNP